MSRGYFFLTHSLQTRASKGAYECFSGHQTLFYIFIYWLVLCYVYFDYLCVLHYVHAWYLWMTWGWAYKRLWVTMWGLGIEPGPSGKADSVLNHWAISTATKHSIINYYESNYWLWEANLRTSSQRASPLKVGHYHTTKLRQCITVETMHHSQVQLVKAFQASPITSFTSTSWMHIQSFKRKALCILNNRSTQRIVFSTYEFGGHIQTISKPWNGCPPFIGGLSHGRGRACTVSLLSFIPLSCENIALLEFCFPSAV